MLTRLTKQDIGTRVAFIPRDGRKKELGVITSFNDRYVFVRYDHQHPTAFGQATRREDLFRLPQKKQQQAI